jgi:TonB family protein
MDDAMPYDRDPGEPSRFRALLSRMGEAARAAGGWLGPIVFLLALAVGLASSALWLHFHPRTPLHASGSETALVLDPVHKPLPAPTTGGTASVPPAPASATNFARIDSPAIPEAGPVAESSAYDPNQGTAEITPVEPETANEQSISSMRQQAESGPAASDAEAQVLARTEPEYPADAMPAQGEVRLRVSVDAQGGVSEVRIVGGSGSDELDHAAVEAVRGWHYKPALRGGQPIAGTVTVAVDYKLTEQR